MCGNAADFTARVRQRTSAVRFVQRGQRISVRLRIERSGPGLDASVSIEAPGRAPLRRHIESPDCEDALDALALVVAIGVEGRSAAAAGVPAPRTRPRRGPRPPPHESSHAPASEPLPQPEAAPPLPATDAPTPASGEPPASAPVSTPPEVSGPDVASEPSPAPSTPPTTSAPSEPPRAEATVFSSGAPEPEIDAAEPVQTGGSRPFHVGAGLSAQMSLGVAPRPLLGGELWIAAGYDGKGVWFPELIINATHQRLDGLTRASGEVDFALSAGGVSFCPVRLASPILQVRPCGAVVIGQLSTHAYETYDARSTDRPWRTLGGSIELLSTIGIVELRAAIGAAAPLIRDEFRFGLPCSGPACGADVFHRVAPVIWSGAAGAGIRFW